jgi:hypothetical protein
LWQVYVPLHGDITLHLCDSSATPPISGSLNTAPDSITHPQANQLIASSEGKDMDSKDMQNRVTVKGIDMGGCALFPGSQVLIVYICQESSKKYRFQALNDLIFRMAVG